jgi:hypothetical protein
MHLAFNSLAKRNSTADEMLRIQDFQAEFAAGLIFLQLDSVGNEKIVFEIRSSPMSTPSKRKFQCHAPSLT